ncbi:ATP-binding protein [Anaerobaca lacustris]|uniref:ATP-binding protein n=1 Tax=Anaerobaca lacustris TaxID=3044600 RepID=A0AAW6U979_9BACT|nr:ATP-binding protein [Sedimentisphaerales bacterium M17dextr]
MTRVQDLCRKLKPVLGPKIDRLWAVYLAESDAEGKADIEQMLELLAARHLGHDYQPDRSPFPPPDRRFAESGDIRLGVVSYGRRQLYPFTVRSGRLKEHLLIAGRSGSGKTNLTFVLMQGIMAGGIKVLALDWKRGYRDLLTVQPDLHVHTIGRDVSPFRFNPLIPPPGCEPNVWIKLIVDVIASAYLGGEGVISLLVAGLDKLFREAGVYDHLVTRWPTIADLLAWLQTVKLRGRAALWQASAERILLAMTYGEFGSVVQTQDNAHVRDLLYHNVVLEMDGLSSNSDRTMFSEALTLYLYRYRLAQGPQDKLTNVIVLEEAHNLLLAKQAGAKESVLETSIRMIRQYGMGYVFVDQSASMLSKVAFANSYGTIALSQKLRADVQTISGAMNLTDEQREALNTLPVGTAIVRLADEFPEPFLIEVPRFPIQEGSVSDEMVRYKMAGYITDSGPNRASQATGQAVPPVPPPDKIETTHSIQENPHPPSPRGSPVTDNVPIDPGTNPPNEKVETSREEIRFLADVAARPLSTTVSRYQRLNLSRRKGNAIRQHLDSAGLIESVVLATRSGQVVLYQLTDAGRAVCRDADINPGARSRASLEHRYWTRQAYAYFENEGYQVTAEHHIDGNGAVDLLAERPGERIAVEVETGKSDIKANLAKVRDAGFDRIVLVATSPAAVGTCQKALADAGLPIPVELMTWLDL